MKLKRLEIEGFRGALPPFPLSLDEKSCFILAENGFGKSTIADALEFLPTAKIEAYRREGYGLDAVVHVDASEASVTVRTSALGADLQRTLKGSAPSDLTRLDDGTKVELAEMPLLRHETVHAFMSKTPGEKKRELLALLGLSELNDFRDVLRTTRGLAEKKRERAVTAVATELSLLDAQLEGAELVARAEELRSEASLAGAVGDEAALLALDLGALPSTHQPDRPGAIERLERAFLELPAADPATAWNAALADREAKEKATLAALLSQGREVLSGWEANSCPLCRSGVDRFELDADLAARGAELAAVKAQVIAIEADFDLAISAWATLDGALEKVVDLAPPGGWPEADSLATAREQTASHLASLRAAKKDEESAPAAPDLGLEAELSALKAAAVDPGLSTQSAALLALSRLQGHLAGVVKARVALADAVRAEAAASAILAIADRRISAAIDAALGDLSGLVADYYGRLVAAGTYSEVKLTYEERRSGEVEFSVLYDARKSVRPPQRVMSASQLNALALALFLARAKREDQPWRTLVLDDVVNSFDSPHRSGLIRLLGEDFGDWQVLLLSHDRAFSDVARETVSGGWRFHQIVAWTPKGGPVLADGRPIARLRELIDAGLSAAEIGSSARAALEATLARPVSRLGYLVPLREATRPTAMTLLIALQRGLKKNGSELAGSAALARIAADSYMANLGSHHQTALPTPSVDDVIRLATDLEALEADFTCENCHTAVWTVPSGSAHTCGCGTLKA
jgi:RecF/RecN/SMC N terminal domain